MCLLEVVEAVGVTLPLGFGFVVVCSCTPFVVRAAAAAFVIAVLARDRKRSPVPLLDVAAVGCVVDWALRLLVRTSRSVCAPSDAMNN